jgi:cell division protein ZapD
VTVFEFPLNEKIRAYLRADELLQRLASLIEGESSLEHHFAIQTLFELQEMANRSDIKGDLIRDLDRQRQGLTGLRGNPDIQEQRLEATLANFNARHEALAKMSGKPGQQLNELDWLNALRGRMSIPAGTCAFDLPAYHHWGQQPSTVRQRELHALLLHFAPLQRAIGLLLDVLRQSGEPRAVVANSGQLQYSVAPGRTIQLLRLDAPQEQHLVPEISANRLAIVIRWMEVDADHRLSPCKRDVNFELSLCS